MAHIRGPEYDIMITGRNDIYCGSCRMFCYKVMKRLNVLTQSGIDQKEMWKGLKKYMEEHPEYAPLYDSANELYRINKDLIEVVFYHDRYSDLKALAGQAFRCSQGSPLSREMHQ